MSGESSPDGLRPASSSPRASGDRGFRCDAAVVFALEIEADPFAAMVADRSTVTGSHRVHEGMLGGRRIAWIVSGAGVGPAVRAAGAVVAGHRPRVLVSAGFAGGLDPAIPRGAVCSAATVARRAGDSLPLAAVDEGIARRVERIVTVDEVVAGVAAKRALHSDTGAALVDMETHGVATVAAAAGVPCLSLRVVSDAAGDELPPEVADLLAPQSMLRRAGAAFAAIGRQPSHARTLWRLWEHAVVDGKTLAATLARAIASLPTEPGA